MLKNNIYILFILLLLQRQIQCQYLNNPSIESEETGAFAPEGWISCHSWSDPDIHEVQEGHSPVDGERTALMRTRGTHYDDNNRKETTEYMLNKLKIPLETGSCYELTAYIVNVYTTISNDFIDPETHPVKFELKGTNDSCPSGITAIEAMASIDEYELLASTGLITDNQFKPYSLRFTVTEENYDYLLIRPFWDTIDGREKYNGIILVDNLSLVKLGETNYPGDTNYLIYSEDPPLQLTAPDASNWDWKPRVKLDKYDIQNPSLIEYHDFYTVIYEGFNGCKYFENYSIILDCNFLYSEEIVNTYNVYFNYDQNIYLYPSPGESYLWSPPDDVSEDTSSSPYIKNYNENFVVTVTDKYNCSFNEVFNIILDCDTLMPENQILILDTLVKYKSEIILKAVGGDPVGAWAPARDLSCAECITTTATSLYNTTYHIDLEKDFHDISCPLTEYFKITIDLEIPNVITPGDQDNKNDLFIIPGIPENSKMRIFDKFGSLVYQSDSYGKDAKWWDGTISGKNGNVKSGNYWYAIEIPDNNETLTGFIYVVR